MSDFVPEPEEARELEKAMPPQRDLSDTAPRVWYWDFGSFG